MGGGTFGQNEDALDGGEPDLEVLGLQRVRKFIPYIEEYVWH